VESDFLWILAEEPVSTVAFVPLAGIAAVFRPLRLRDNNYAGTATSAVVEHLFDEGRPLRA